MSENLPPLPDAPLDEAALLAWLDEAGFVTVTKRHPSLFTVEDSMALRGELTGAHTKNLFLKDRKGGLFMLTAQETSDVPLKHLHKMIGGRGKFSFGSADAMLDILGVTPGAVTALGLVNARGKEFTFALDATLLDHDEINCHPLTNEATTRLATKDLLRLARHCGFEPVIVVLTETPEEQVT